MHVLVTGGGGFIARRLAYALSKRRGLAPGGGEETPINRITLFDQAAPQGSLPDDPRIELRTGDIGDPTTVRGLVAPDTGLIVHLAAVVSAGAEADFDLGMRVNLDGTRNLLEAARALGTAPRLLFASSVAVYGGEVPEVLDDLTILMPQTSYGTQKAAGELLVNDYARKGFVDGRSLRLPTVVVRPGKPNKAASTFASSIIREPLQGQEVVCPVARGQGMYLISPRRVVEAFIRAAELPADAFGMSRSLLLPGITRTVDEMVEALTAVAGAGVARRIRFQPDPDIQRIVSGWPMHFEARRAKAMGFRPDGSMEEIVRAFIEDELDGRYVN